MTDPRTLAQREGPEAMEALVRDVFKYIPWIGPVGLKEVIAAARKLAEPEPVTPKWPSNVGLMAYFDTSTGAFCGLRNPIGPEGMYAPVPCKLVPADAVVLTREEAEKIYGVLCQLDEGHLLDLVHILRAALRREREAP